jgi:hypothetical protein
MRVDRLPQARTSLFFIGQLPTQITREVLAHRRDPTLVEITEGERRLEFRE